MEYVLNKYNVLINTKEILYKMNFMKFSYS
jgi:hypothetical protein